MLLVFFVSESMLAALTATEDEAWPSWEHCYV